MAKKKIHECDWKSCRKRKGVERIYIEVEEYANDATEDDNYCSEGHLCPVHRQVMIDRLAFEDI